MLVKVGFDRPRRFVTEKGSAYVRAEVFDFIYAIILDELEASLLKLFNGLHGHFHYVRVKVLVEVLERDTNSYVLQCIP